MSCVVCCAACNERCLLRVTCCLSVIGLRRVFAMLCTMLCCMLFVGCCMMSIACCMLLYVVCWVTYVGRCCVWFAV